MDCDPASEPADPTLRLTRDAYYIAVHTLRGTLPAPEADTDEACLAAQCVAARLYGMDCIRQAREFAVAKDPVWERKCGAQGLSALRESRQARALLARLQAVREKREADPAATDRAAWSEHCTLGLMTDALAGSPDEPVPVLAPAPSPAQEPPPAPEPAADEAPKRDLAAEAEMYAIMYPRRARLIRPWPAARQYRLRPARSR